MNGFDTDKCIDDFIKEERSLKPNSFLATRVMSKIESTTVEKVWRIRPAWATLAVATALTGVISGGFVLGKMYSSAANTTQSLVIDDSRIENMGYYSAIIAE